MSKIYLQTKINAPRQLVFDLSRSIDLHKISTAKTNEKAIAGKTKGLISLNEIVTWRAKHLGVYQNFKSKIVTYNHSIHFTDIMLSGAFKNFKHEHYYLYLNNQTILFDVLEFNSPFGILGKFVDYVFMKQYLTNFIRFRNKIIKEYAETEKWKLILG